GGESDFRNDQHAAYLLRARAATGAMSCFLQDANQVWIRKMQGGQPAEKNRRAERSKDCERENTHVESELRATEDIAWNQRAQRHEAEIREKNSNSASCDRQQNTFRKELTHEARAAGSQRLSNR